METNIVDTQKKIVRTYAFSLSICLEVILSSNLKNTCFHS